MSRGLETEGALVFSALLVPILVSILSHVRTGSVDQSVMSHRPDVDSVGL